MKLMNEGAEAKIYEEEIFGNLMLNKTREKKKYRVDVLDNELRKNRTRREAWILYKASSVGIPVPKIFALGAYSIYMEKINGKLLKDTSLSSDSFTKIGKLLAQMHSNNIIHGDFTPTNIIRNGNEYIVIDFGLGEISNSFEGKALDLLLMKRAVDPKQFLQLLLQYKKGYKDSKIVLARLDKIEERGRYQARTLA